MAILHVEGQALRAGWHITAVQHLGRWASSQVVEYVEEAHAEEPGPTRRAAPGQLSGKDWAPVPAWEDRIKAVEEAQERSAWQWPAYTLGTVPATPLPAQEDQDSLEEDLFVLLTSVGIRKLDVGASVQRSAPSHARSTRCRWHLSTQGFRLLSQRQIQLGDAKDAGSRRTGSPRLRHKEEENEEVDFQVKHLRTDFGAANLS